MSRADSMVMSHITENSPFLLSLKKAGSGPINIRAKIDP